MANPSKNNQESPKEQPSHQTGMSKQKLEMTPQPPVYADDDDCEIEQNEILESAEANYYQQQ